MDKQNLNSNTKLLGFAQKILSPNSIESLLEALHKEIFSVFKVKTSILLYPLFGLSQKLSLAGESRVKSLDAPSNFLTAVVEQQKSTDDIEIRSQLVKCLERPVGRIMGLELYSNPSQKQIKLFFEHDLPQKKIEALLFFLEQRKSILYMAISNILLELEFRNASVVWEQAFESVSEPAVIVDGLGNIIRGNKDFNKKIRLALSDGLGDAGPLSKFLKNFSPKEGSLSQTWKGAKGIYEVHVYPLKETSLQEMFVVYFKDMSQIHNLQIELVQSEKMVAVGNLAEQISQELNNPLLGIKDLSQTLIKDSRLDKSVKKDLCEVKEAVFRCEKIIKDLQDFSGKDMKEKNQTVSMSQLVSSTVVLLKLVLSPFVVETQYVSNSDDFVEVVPELFRQVVFNVINNACQASQPGKKIVIQVKKNDVQVQLIVRDQGCGMGAEQLDQIFEPFYTTKKQGVGTGLGLSVSSNVVEKFSGEIKVQSKEGAGSEFKVSLPLKKITKWI